MELEVNCDKIVYLVCHDVMVVALDVMRWGRRKLILTCWNVLIDLPPLLIISRINNICEILCT